MKLKLTGDKGNAVGSNYLKHNVCQIHVDLMNGTHFGLRPYDNFMKSFSKASGLRKPEMTQFSKEVILKTDRLLLLETMNQCICSVQFFNISQPPESCPVALPIGKECQCTQPT